MTAVQVVAASLIALVAQGLLTRLTGSDALRADLGLVAVVWMALRLGRVPGLIGGTLVGLGQDALGGGVLGIAGLSKSVAGFLTGIAGTQFIVTHAVPRFLVFAGASALNALLFVGLSIMLGLRSYDRPYVHVAVQSVSNAVLGVLLFSLIEYLPGARERWRVARAYRKERRYR